MGNVNILATKVSLAADSSFPASVRLASVGSIDGKTTAATTLYTVPTGKTAIITKVVIVLTAATNVTGDPDVGVGIAATYDSLMPSTTLTSMQTALETWVYNIDSLTTTTAAAAVIKFEVDTGATTTGGGDVYTLRVDLFGYLY